MERDDDTLGPCGCTDYHMADCDLVTGGSSYDYADDEELADWME